MATLPTRMVGTFWQDSNTSNPLTDMHANTNVIYVAFAKGLDATSGTLVERGVHLGTYTQSALITAVATMKAAGATVMLSVGGSDDVIGMSGVNYQLSTAGQQANAISSLNSLISTYGFDGIDWDLESAYLFTVSAAAAVLNQVASDNPGLLITLTPEHFDANNSSGTYRQLGVALGSNLSMIQPQFYNASFFTSKAVWQNQISVVAKSLAAQFGQTRVGIGLEIVSGNIASHDAGTYTMTPAEFNAIWDSIMTTHPGIRGAFVWSSNSDKSSGYDFADTVGDHILATPSGGGGSGAGEYDGDGTEDLSPNFW